MIGKVLSTRQAADYLRSRVDDLAPSLRTLQNWARPSWREQNAALVAQAAIPMPARIPGVKRLAWAKTSLDRWVERLAKRAEDAAGIPEDAAGIPAKRAHPKRNIWKRHEKR